MNSNIIEKKETDSARKKNNLGGRPPKADSDKKQKEIKISLSAAEYAFVEAHAKKSGCKQIARFMRECLLCTIEQGKFSYVQPREISRELVDNIYRIGVNLNQIAYQLNQKGSTVAPILSPLERSIVELRNLLMPFLGATHTGVTCVAEIDRGGDHGNS